ncbi:MAG: tryptophan-rich sensory protein [Flavobacteriales bacterium]|nr:tryptophan-rich sensory protein [Flavobacteriales bacterium]MCB9190495.1 tryptophan-rich sensory protein [Flavobacteriales bacterium]
MWKPLLVFLILNFGALGIGGLLMGGEVQGEWYQSLNKAPWTPPGWVFGAAWTTIMLCFSIYMAYAWQEIEPTKLLITLFSVQWILNVFWNPVFFKFHQVGAGLLIITALTLLVGYFLLGFLPQLRYKALLVLPYFVWLLIATSLNGYVLLKN